MKYFKFLILLIVVLTTLLKADPVSVDKAAIVAKKAMEYSYGRKIISIIDTIVVKSETEIIAYCFVLKDSGFVKVSADDFLPPVTCLSSLGFVAKDLIVNTEKNPYKPNHDQVRIWSIVFGDKKQLLGQLVLARKQKSLQNKYSGEWDYYLNKKLKRNKLLKF